MQYLLAIAGAGLVYVLYTALKSFFQSKSVANEKETLKEIKDESTKAVAAADASYDNFMERLRKYKSTDGDK